MYCVRIFLLKLECRSSKPVSYQKLEEKLEKGACQCIQSLLGNFTITWYAKNFDSF